MSDPLRLVIFDLDGTLVDSAGGIHRCISLTLERYKLPPVSSEFVREGIGLGLMQAWQRIVPEADPSLIDQLSQTYREFFLETRRAGEEQDPLFPGAKEALTQLDNDGYLLAIATNKGRPGVHYVLDLHGIGDHFIAIRSAHDGPPKPHPDAIHDILTKTSVGANETIFIGDTQTDMMTAKNAGVAALGVGWGYQSESQLLGSGAHAIATAFEDLPALVCELIGQDR